MAQLVARAGLLRPRHRGAGIPGLGLPALRPRVAQCRGGGAAHDRAVALGAREGPRPAFGAAHHRQRRAAARAGARVRCDATRCRSRPAMSSAWHGIVDWLELNGFTRASTVREPGDYAVRGGILDLFPPGMDMPVRLDFFGDALETMRTFDPQTQRSEGELRALDLVPVAEFQLVTETIRRFRTGYVAEFGAASPDDLLVRSGERGPPLSRHGALAAAVPRQDWRRCSIICRARRWRSSIWPRTPRIERFAQDRRLLRGARAQALKQGVTPPYKPLPPERLYLGEAEWRERLEAARPGAAHALRGAGRRQCDRHRRARRAQFRRRARRARRQCVRGGEPSTCWRCKRPASASASRCGARARASA